MEKEKELKIDSAKSKNYNSIDIVKFICALFVVILHVATYSLSSMAVDGHPPTGAESGPLILYVLPLAYSILRIAVPFFFISSAFFLFKKMNKCETAKEKNDVVKKYCIRLLLLYCFWTILSLPYMLDKCLYNSGYGVEKGIAVYVLRFVTLNAFDGAWYIGASIICALLVHFMSKKLNNYSLLGVSAVLYIIAVLDGAYFNIFTGLISNSDFMFLHSLIPGYESFLNGTIFFVIGKIFAEKENRISLKQSIFMTILFFILMYCELIAVNYLGVSYATDAYFTLVPFSFYFFQMILNINLKDRKAFTFLRKTSTFIYLSHFVILYVLFRFVHRFGWTVFTTSIPVMIATYIGVVGLSIVIYLLISWLMKKKGFKWLKYSI